MSHRIGLEISTTSVRMAEVANGDDRPRLLTFAQVRLPAGAVVDGSIVDEDAVRAAIERCKREGGFGGVLRMRSALPVRLSVAGLQAIMREIEMPPVPPEELDAAVRLQAVDIIPFPEDQTLFSARPIGTTTDENGTPLLRILLAAAHRELVTPFVRCASEAGLRPDGVDLAASALVRAIGGGQPGELEAIVSIGADLTTVVVHEQGDPLFVRTIAEGGNVVTQALSTALDLPLADAEKLKRHLNGDAGQVPPEALHAAREGTARLLSEIRSSIDYFAALPGRGEVRRVAVTGAGAQLAELVDRLQLQLIAPVALDSVFEHVDTSDIGAELRPLDPVDLSSAVAIGLARPTPPGTKEIDLLPPEVRAQHKRQRIQHQVIAAAAAIVALLVVTGLLRWNSVRSAASQVAALQSRVAALTAELPRYDKIEQEHRQIEADQATALPLVEDEVNWIGSMQALRQHLPPGLKITSFNGQSLGTQAVVGTTVQPPNQDVDLAQVNISLVGPQFVSFQNWLDAFNNTPAFVVENWSSLDKDAAAGANSVTWQSTLDITGVVHSARLGQYELSTSTRRSR
jgi:type IV pilus assembly protein PilM